MRADIQVDDDMGMARGNGEREREKQNVDMYAAISILKTKPESKICYNLISCLCGASVQVGR